MSKRQFVELRKPFDLDAPHDGRTVYSVAQSGNEIGLITLDYDDREMEIDISAVSPSDQKKLRKLIKEVLRG